MIPFKTQYEKLMKAYVSNRVDPWDCEKCFCGNLLNEIGVWAVGRTIAQITQFTGEVTGIRIIIESSQAFKNTATESIEKESDGTYTLQDICALEYAFLSKILVKKYSEEALFEGFQAALLKLREIHEAKGEIIDDYVFKKRNVNDFFISVVDPYREAPDTSVRRIASLSLLRSMFELVSS